MKEISLTQFVAILGGWSALIIIISKYLCTLSINKLNIHWKSIEDKSLALYKSELDKNQSIFNNIYTQYTSGFHIGQERRIKAIEVLWINLRSLIAFSNERATLIYNILPENEILNFWERKSDNSMFSSFKIQLKNYKQTDFTDGFLSQCEKIDLERPFLGEKIYDSYNVYKVFLGRITHLIIDGIEKQQFIHWHNDEALVELLKNSLTNAEFKYVMSMKIRTYELTCILLETKLLEQINKLISGDVVTQNALDIVQKYVSYNLQSAETVQ